MERWRGKVAIVTGASAGIGAAVVEKLVGAGLKVVGFARRKDRLDAISKTLQNQPGEFYPFEVDVTKEEDILKAFGWVTEKLGPVHILINNAGIGKPTTLIGGSTQQFRDILETNVLGVAVATREAVQNMRENDVAGHVIHMNSVAGHYVPHVPQMNIYPASKFAVTAMAETLRQELNVIGSKIKITSLSPGLVDTDIFLANGHLKDENIAEMLKVLPKLRSADVADAVLYVLGTPAHVQITELTIRPVGEVP